MKNPTLIMFIVFSSIVSSPLMAKATDWSCGDWKKDPKGKCEEIQTCTRTVCSTKGKIEGCQTETKTSCANPIPPTTTKPSAFIKANPIASPLKAIKTIPETRSKPAAGSLKIRQPAILAPVGQPPVPVQKKLPVNPRGMTTQQQNTTFAPYSGAGLKKFRKIETPNTGDKVYAPETRNPALDAIKRNQLKAPGNAGFVGEEIKEASIKNSVLENIIKSIFQGTQIRFNNYGPRHDNSWYKGNDSFIKLSTSLGGMQKKFSVPAVNYIPKRYYVNDLNSTSLTVSLPQFDGPPQLTIIFDINPRHIKGHCATNNVLKKALCSLGADLSTADVGLDKVTARILLDISIKNGTLSFSNTRPKVSLISSIHSTDAALTDYERMLDYHFKTEMNALISSAGATNKIENAIRAELEKNGIKNVFKVRHSVGKTIFRFRS